MLRDPVVRAAFLGTLACAVLLAPHLDARVYTADELATMVPTTANPWLAILPADVEPDWDYWRARMAYEGQLRARERQPTGPMVVIEEAEATDTTGFNDLPADAEILPGFGSRVGQIDRAMVRGTIRPLPTLIDPGVPGDAIPGAPLVTVAPGERVVTTGAIGDSPFGSTGTGEGDFDWFRVQVAAGQRLELLVRTPEPLADLDPILALLRPDGTLLAFNNNFQIDGFLQNLDSYIEWIPDETGELIFVVGGRSTLVGNQDEEEMLPADPFDPTTGPGAESEGSYTLVVALDARDPGDVDRFAVPLRTGDVIGATTTGDARRVFLSAPDGSLLFESQVDISGVLPRTSPMPAGGRAAIAYVVEEAGIYTLGVRDADRFGIGPYDIEIVVARPRFDEETEPISQTVFVDFDGASFDGGLFGLPPGRITLSPLAAYLSGWGLGPADEDTVIDAILATVRRQLDEEIKTLGANGDFEASGIVGQFDVELRNSRDDPDPGFDPTTSRVVVGGSIDQLGLITIGIAQSIDPGNFKRAETGIVLLDLLSEPDVENPNSLNGIPRAPGVGIVDVIAAAVGTIVSHEAGHMLANFHTRRDVGPPTVMDRGGSLFNRLGIGPDGIFGTDDDAHVGFGDDGYTPAEGLAGIENTLDALSFDMARGGLRPDVAVDTLVLDFGAVPLGAQPTRTLTITNEGSTPLTGTVSLTAADAGGPLTVDAGAGAFRLAPDEPRAVEVRFDAADLGPAAATLTVATDDDDEPTIVIPIRAQGGVPAISVAPADIDFGALVYGDASTSIDGTITIDNAGPGTLEVSTIESSGPDAFAFVTDPQALPFSLAPGDQRDIDVRYRPGGPVGAMDGRLRIRGNDPTQPVDLPVRGVAFGPDIDVMPTPPFLFLPTRLDEVRDRTFTVVNLGSRTLDVDRFVRLDGNGDSFQIVSGAPPFSLAPSESRELTLRFTPQRLGLIVASFQLLGNDPDESPFAFIVGGPGVLPQASVMPTEVDFGPTAIGDTRFRPLDVINDGNGRLFVQAPQILGPDAAAFSLNVNSLFFVDPGETFRILGRFMPDATRSYEATLRLETDDPARPVIDVPLRGLGIDAFRP